jgi:phospholipid/cholesterol/gamma-HCH transport system permease protein
MQPMAKRPKWIVSIMDFLAEIGEIGSFISALFWNFLRHGINFQELSKQCYRIGNKSLPLISITGFILGLVLTLQSGPTLAKFGAESMLPGMVSLSIIREIGPVIVALIVAGKVGSGIGAELASMRVSEQLDAMEVSGTNPISFVVTTRVLGVSLMLPLLVLYADALSILGSFISAHAAYSISFEAFIHKAFDVIHFSDLIPTILKTFFFGFAIGIIGSYKGYYAKRGTEGVGEAANSAVVLSSISIFVIDLLAVQLSHLML